MRPAWVYSKTPAPPNTPQIEDKLELLLWFMVCCLPHISLLGVSPPVYLAKHRSIPCDWVLHTKESAGTICIHVFSKYWIKCCKSSVESV